MPFEYRPFVNPYISSMSDLMGRGVEARSRAELSVAEAQAGAAGRLGDITGAQWSGLGDTLAGGIDAYVTEQREAPIREHAALLRAEQLKEIARGDEGRERQDLASTLLAETLAGRPDPEEVQPYERPRFRGIPSGDIGSTRDAAGNFVRAEPMLEEAAPSGPSGAPYHRFDVRGMAQEAAEGNFLQQMGPGLQILEALNANTDRRFNEAYDRSKETFSQLLDQSPEELMSGGAQFLEHFSRELGESPQFQGLINALETGDPRAFETAVRRYTETPHTFGETVDERLARIHPDTGEITPGRPDPETVRARKATEAYRLQTAQDTAAYRAAVFAERESERRVDSQSAATLQERQREGIHAQAEQTLNEVDRLLRFDEKEDVVGLSPGMGSIVGKSKFFGGLSRYRPGSQEADAVASLNRVSSRLIVDLMAEMKAQSRTGATGFGQLSEAELAILQSGSARLDTMQSDEAMLDALKVVRRLVQKSFDQSLSLPSGAQSVRVATPTPTPDNVPQVGERRTIGGQLGEWDGQGWVAVQ
jgi:hypothetical protein